MGSAHYSLNVISTLENETGGAAETVLERTLPGGAVGTPTRQRR